MIIRLRFVPSSGILSLIRQFYGWKGARMRGLRLVFVVLPTLLAGSVAVGAADAGSIVSWGAIAFDSNELDANDFMAVSAGGHHSIALKKDGSIVGWGYNEYGQASPPEGNDFIAVAAGHHQSLAIRKEPCLYRLVGDLNGDCRVDLLDFAMMASNWLIDCDLTPEDPACVPK